MKATSCDVGMPVFKCLGPVSRDQGLIGIEARTNVELQYLQSEGLAFIDTSELSGPWWQRSSNPLLLAYKFLDANFTLALKVKKHGDVGVLIAVIESAHVTMTQTEEGRMITRMVASVRNTQKQFLRVAIPKDSDVWTAVVGSRAVKPARDDDGKLMIPLQKTTRQEDEQAAKHTLFTVELVYFQSMDRMNGWGRLNFQLPEVDLPNNKLFVSIWLPPAYIYGEFEGDVKEVETSYFSSSPPHASSVEDDGRTVQMVTNPLVSQVRQPMMDQKRPDRVPGSKGMGVLPVKVDVPTNGTEFKFEQLLVSSAALRLTVDYRRLRQGCCQRRRLDACSIL